MSKNIWSYLSKLCATIQPTKEQLEEWPYERIKDMKFEPWVEEILKELEKND